jgi:hypothetical protein
LQLEEPQSELLSLSAEHLNLFFEFGGVTHSRSRS